MIHPSGLLRDDIILTNPQFAKLTFCPQAKKSGHLFILISGPSPTPHNTLKPPWLQDQSFLLQIYLL